MSDEYKIADAYWRERTKALGEEESIGDYLLRRRADGLSLRQIADELRDVSAKRVAKTPTTIGAWLRAAESQEGDDEPVEAVAS